MSRAGKFIPGGAGKKTGGIAARTAPIRAPQGPSAPGDSGKKKTNPLLSKGAGLIKPVPKNRRLPILIMSGITCCVLVSVAWYEMGVLPARRELMQERTAAALTQQKLQAALTAQTAKEKLPASAYTTVTIDSNPSGTVTIGDLHQPTPATFNKVPLGKVTVVVHAEGFDDFTQEVTTSVDKPLDLGTVQLARRMGTLALSTTEPNVTYTLTGPGGYSHQGQLPETLDHLPVGVYQLAAQMPDWQLPPQTLTLHNHENLQKQVQFPFASAMVATVPPGATVRNGKAILGQTPLNLTQLHPGTMNLSVDLPPYTLQHVVLTIPENGNVTKQIDLQQGRDFIAACGMPLVWIPDGFWAGKYDVTQRIYETVTNYNPSNFRRPSRPVENVSWTDAMGFCEKLNDDERRAGRLPVGFHYTLPTESQWDSFNADADISQAAMSRLETLSSTQDVGASEPNKYGLYDTLGNVWQWCLDSVDEQGDHSLRGGSWLSSSDNFPSAETRISAAPKYADRFTGFRVVLVPDK